MGLPYGDQGLLISRALYDEVGGYPDVPLMEDVMLVRAVGKGVLSSSMPKHAPPPQNTSATDGANGRGTMPGC